MNLPPAPPIPTTVATVHRSFPYNLMPTAHVDRLLHRDALVAAGRTVQPLKRKTLRRAADLPTGLGDLVKYKLPTKNRVGVAGRRVGAWEIREVTATELYLVAFSPTGRILGNRVVPRETEAEFEFLYQQSRRSTVVV